MHDRGPREAVRESLAQPVTQWISGQEPAPWVAVPSTLQFLSERDFGDRRVYAVAFEDEADRSWTHVYLAERDASGTWRAIPAGGGWGDDQSGGPGPRVTLTGSWYHGFFAGGPVIDPDDCVRRVRLIGDDGTGLEDGVTDGWALFWTDLTMRRPFTVELYDAAGSLLAHHGV